MKPLCNAELEVRANYHANNELSPIGCDDPPSAYWLDRPVVEAVQSARRNASYASEEPTNGWCVFHQYTSCAVAEKRKNYNISSLTWMMSYAALRGQTEDAAGFTDRLITSTPGTFSQDAEFCQVAGYFDIPQDERTRILANYSYAVAKGKEECIPLAERVQNITFKDMASMELGYSFRRFASIMLQQAPESNETVAQPFMTDDDVAVYKAYFCAMSGTTACQMHFCLANFCKLADGQIGSGCQCGDWELAPIPRSA